MLTYALLLLLFLMHGFIQILFGLADISVVLFFE